MSKYDDLNKKVEQRISKLDEYARREEKIELIQEFAEADLERAELNERRRAIQKEKHRQHNGRKIKAKRTR